METFEEFMASAASYARKNPFVRMRLRPLGGERGDCYPDPQDGVSRDSSSHTIHVQRRAGEGWTMTDWADEKAREILGKYAGRSFRGVTADIAAALRSAVEEERRALDEFAKHVSWSLDWIAEPEEEPYWAVHEVNGGINDREWNEIGKGDTPRAAIADAIAARAPPEQK